MNIIEIVHIITIIYYSYIITITIKYHNYFHNLLTRFFDHEPGIPTARLGS